MLGDKLEGWDGVGGGREVQEGGDTCVLWFIHGDVWQKPTRHFKAIILQLEINKFNTKIQKKKKKKESHSKWSKQLQHGSTGNPEIVVHPTQAARLEFIPW